MLFRVVCLLTLLVGSVCADAIDLGRPLIYELNDRSAALTLADLDGDGRLDVLTTNNAEGTIDVLYARSPEEIAESDEPEPKPHTKEEIISGRQVDSLALGDLDGNGLLDVVVGSDRGGAAIFFQTEPRTFETARRLRAPGSFVVVGDWDGNGADEMLAFGVNERPPLLTCLVADEDREISTQWSASISTGAGEPPLLRDWDSDGDLDLLWTTVERTEVHVLLNSGDGGVGGEMVVEIGQAFDWAPMATEAGMTVLTVERSSATLRLLAPGEESDIDEVTSFGAPLHVALAEADSAGKMTPALVESDEGRDAIYIPSRRTAQALLLSLNDEGQAVRTTLEGFSEVDSVQTLTDGSLLILSRGEGAIGIAPPPEAGARPPQPLPLTLEPLAAVVADLNASPGDDLFVIGRSGESREIEAQITPHGISSVEPVSVELPNLPTDDPTSLHAGDVDGDGKADLMVFYAYRAPLIYLQSEEGWKPLSERFQVPNTFFEGVTPSQMWLGDLHADNTPDLLIARGGLVRVLSFNAAPQVEVLAQINAPRTGMDFSAVTAHDGMIIAIDRTESVAVVCETVEDDGWQVASEIDLQMESPQTALCGDWNSDGITDLLVKGANEVGMFFGGKTSPPLAQLATAQSPLEEGRFARVQAIAWDGELPLAHVVDHRHHTLLIWRWDPDEDQWQDFCLFKVYETPNDMRYDWERDLERVNVQPREFAVGDTDGDGRDDLVLLAHDKVLIYPRED